MLYKAKEGHNAGEIIGILLVDAMLPLIPGDVANATTFSFPVRYKVVKGATPDRLIYQRDPALLELFLEAGKELVQEGVRAITCSCGYMALFQEEMANALPVPVFTSSLLQLSFISHTLSRGDKVGIIAADSHEITKAHLRAAGVNETISLKITGMENQTNFYNTFVKQTGILDFEKAEQEVIEVARNMVTEDNKVKAILFECSNLPPYAASVQEAVNIPVYDFITMINYVFSTLVRRRFLGFG